MLGRMMPHHHDPRRFGGGIRAGTCMHVPCTAFLFRTLPVLDVSPLPVYACYQCASVVWPDLGPALGGEGLRDVGSTPRGPVNPQPVEPLSTRGIEPVLERPWSDRGVFCSGGMALPTVGVTTA